MMVMWVLVEFGDDVGLGRVSFTTMWGLVEFGDEVGLGRVDFKTM